MDFRKLTVNISASLIWSKTKKSAEITMDNAAVALEQGNTMAYQGYVKQLIPSVQNKTEKPEGRYDEVLEDESYKHRCFLSPQ